MRLLKTNTDQNVVLELLRTENILRPDKFDNVFNIREKFEDERQQSLKFCVYGIIESDCSDCDHININVKLKDSETFYYRSIIRQTGNTSSSYNSGTSFNILSKPLSVNGELSKNLYSRQKGYFFFPFEIDERLLMRGANHVLNTKSLVFTIDDPVKKLVDDFELPFIFYDEDGVRIDFGTESAEMYQNGNIVEINNDYPFLYNRHWIKYDLRPRKWRRVFISDPLLININESIPGGTFAINVSLDFPSRTGTESIDVVLDEDNTFREPNLDFNFTSQRLSWNVGEQYKQFVFNVFDDFFAEELADSVSFKLRNPVNVLLDETKDKVRVYIGDNDVKSKASFSGSAINIVEFNGFVTIGVNLDSPVLVPNQSIDVVLLPSPDTTATIQTEFNIDEPNLLATTKTLHFDIGDTYKTFNVNIFDDFIVEKEKQIKFKLQNPTQNIHIDGQGDTYTIHIQDSMVLDRFARIIFPISKFTYEGLYRVNKREFNVGLYTYAHNEDVHYAYDHFSNAFNVQMDVVNLGDKILYNGNFIPTNSVLFSLSINSMTGSTVYVDLPGNTNISHIGHFFREAKYAIRLKPSKHNLWQQWNTQDKIFNTYDDINIDFHESAGLATTRKYYIETKLFDLRAAYNQDDDVCYLQTSNQNITHVDIELMDTPIITNSLLFLPKVDPLDIHQGDRYTTVNYEITQERVNYRCHALSANNQNGYFEYMPFGFERIQTPLINKTVKLNFGQILFQAGAHISYSSLKQESTTNPQTGFFKYENANTITKEGIQIEISNNGVSDVVLFNNVPLFAGNTITISNNDIFDFNNMVMYLPTNDGFSYSSHTFERASYSIKFKNIKLTRLNGSLVNFVPFNISIDPVNLIGDIFNNIPEYNLITRLRKVIPPRVSSNVVQCGGNNFVLPHVNVDIKGICFKYGFGNQNISYVEYMRFEDSAYNFTEICADPIPFQVRP